jgi:hypothetical protein
MYQTEQERQDEFVDLMGGHRNAEKLYRIWQNSYPRFCSIPYGEALPRQHTKEEVFTASAKEQGFTKKQIEMFLSL